MKNILAENMRRFKTKNLSAQQAIATGAATKKRMAAFDFQFDEGKYLSSEIPNNKLTALAGQLIPIFKELKTPTLANGITKIFLTANTSPTPINQKGSLPAAGITNNQQLADARMNTLETIINDLLKKSFPTVDPADVLAKVTFQKTTKPGTDTKIGIIAEQIGTVPLNPIMCNLPATQYKGNQGTASNGYVGYNKIHELFFTLDSKATITFNPLQIPDAFWIKYGDQEIFSGFIGAKTYGQDQKNSVNELKKIPNLVDTINGVIAKNGGTAKADINTIFNGVQQGGQSQFTFPLTKNFKNNNIHVIVFAPLSTTIFEISTNC